MSSRKTIILAIFFMIFTTFSSHLFCLNTLYGSVDGFLENMIVIDQDEKLYKCDKNMHKERLKWLDDECLVQVAIGCGYYFALNQDGRVFSYKIKPSQNSLNDQNEVLFNRQKVLKISANVSHVLFLLENNTIAVLWSNEAYLPAIGLNESDIKCSDPVPITIYLIEPIHHDIAPDLGDLKKTKIIKACAGRFHSIFLNEEGIVYTCGNNHYGQSGHKRPLCDWFPTKIKELSNIVDIEAGDQHSLALERNGTVYFFGARLPQDNLATFGPKKLELGKFYKIIAMAAAYDVSLFLTEKNEVIELRTENPLRIIFRGDKDCPVKIGISKNHNFVLTSLGDLHVLNNERENTYEKFAKFLIDQWTPQTHWKQTKSVKDKISILLMLQKRKNLMNAFQSQYYF